MKRYPLEISDEYIAALSERLGFDLRPQSLVTRIGKAYIAENAEIVSRISKGLTTNRTEFLASGYLKDEKIRRAYTLYYMTTNLLKVVAPLRELSLSNFFERNSPINILDLGTGTGAAVWGTLNYLHESVKNRATKIMLTDSHQENLREAEIFSGHFLKQYPSVDATLAYDKYDLRKPQIVSEKIKNSAPYHLLTMMNVLNELDENNDTILFESLMSLLDEHGSLLMIEPATRDQSRRLLRFRDLAVYHSATIYSPCTRQANCPALVKEDDWCHTENHWLRPPFIKAIDDIVGTLRLSLKYTYLIIRKDGVTLGDIISQKALKRAVSERFDEKGRVRSILCGESGRYEHIINKRDLSKSNQDFSEIQRYDLVESIGEEAREHDVRLPKESGFNIVLPILGAR